MGLIVIGLLIGGLVFVFWPRGSSQPAAPSIQAILVAVAAGDQASEATKPVAQYDVHLNAAGLRTANRVIEAEYLRRSCVGINRLFHTAYTWRGEIVEPGMDCRWAVQDQRREGQLWLARGTLKTVRSGCENVATQGDKPTFHASECLVFKVVGKQQGSYPWETIRLVLRHASGRWIVLFESPDYLASDGGQALWKQRVTGTR
jgi:hypothetical protein